MKFKKGFTLIELLVVIAIVGILASIVLASISSSRNPDPDTLPRTSRSDTVFPEPTNFVVDDAGVLATGEYNNILTRLEKINKDGNAQVAVLLVKTTAPLSIEEYGIELAEKWKVGMKDLDNGAIVIVATEDRKVRIEVGKGLEGYIPDATAGRIIDEYMMSYLKKGDWYGAVDSAVGALNDIILTKQYKE